MTDMEAVKARYPYAVARKWQGRWTIYRMPIFPSEDFSERYVISLATSTEAEAWNVARAIIEAP